MEDAASARPRGPDTKDNRTNDQGLGQLVAILDRDGGLMPANREHPLWALWASASGGEDGSADPDALATFRTAYADWLAQKPILLK